MNFKIVNIKPMNKGSNSQKHFLLIYCIIRNLNIVLQFSLKLRQKIFQKMSAYDYELNFKPQYFGIVKVKNM
jgi:hypothetical protein